MLSVSTSLPCFSLFFFNHTATPEIYTLSLHDALPICSPAPAPRCTWRDHPHAPIDTAANGRRAWRRSTPHRSDRKSTRLNSSHTVISYAVFCLKKKKKK